MRIPKFLAPIARNDDEASALFLDKVEAGKLNIGLPSINDRIVVRKRIVMPGVEVPPQVLGRVIDVDEGVVIQLEQDESIEVSDKVWSYQLNYSDIAIHREEFYDEIILLRDEYEEN